MVGAHSLFIDSVVGHFAGVCGHTPHSDRDADRGLRRRWPSVSVAVERRGECGGRRTHQTIGAVPGLVVVGCKHTAQPVAVAFHAPPSALSFDVSAWTCVVRRTSTRLFFYAYLFLPSDWRRTDMWTSAV